VFGIGGIGGFYGGKIANEISKGKKDYEVYFVARGEHLKQIQNNGLILNTPEEKGIICKPEKAVENFAQLPEADLIFACVKNYDLPGAIKDIAENCKKDAYIIPLLNGVDIYDRIREHLNNGVVFPSCVYIGTAIEKPGTVTQLGGNGIIHLGKDPKHIEVIPEDLFAFLNEMGIKYKWYENSLPAIWEKFIFIAGFGIYTAYSGKVFGEIMADENSKQEVRNIMNEIVALAKAEGITFSETIVEDSLNKANNFAYDTKTSYQRDVEQKGKKNEGDLLGGTIIRLGKKYNIPTTTTERFYKLLV
jgi:2-dehydropantoate 2-reductase